MLEQDKRSDPNEQELLRLMRLWDKGEQVSRSGRFFSLALFPLGYPEILGGQAIPAFRGPPSFSDTGAVADAEWIEQFDRWDRAATRAGNRHRDRVVALHLLAAWAVLTAVLGAINLWGLSHAWAVAELLILSNIIWLVLQERRPGASVHHAWLVLRQRAEGFRTTALLRGFAAGINLPLQGRAAPLLALLEDQIRYHKKAHGRWDQLDRGLEQGARWIFYLVALAVAGHMVPVAADSWKFLGQGVPPYMEAVSHFLHSPKWLILTAAGPAFAACLHSIGNKLEVKRLAAQAEAMAQHLTKLQADVTGLKDEGSAGQLGELAKRIAEAMNAEHETWVGLLKDGHLQIPA